MTANARRTEYDPMTNADEICNNPKSVMNNGHVETYGASTTCLGKRNHAKLTIVNYAARTGRPMDTPTSGPHNVSSGPSMHSSVGSTLPDAPGHGNTQTHCKPPRTLLATNHRPYLCAIARADVHRKRLTTKHDQPEKRLKLQMHHRHLAQEQPH